ncbi:MAG: DUF541 domain-containing protein [Alphaproteobacteria bacterium]|nr:DUF541 domain-containing protein [Alphaproteobacteria bacterium]
MRRLPPLRALAFSAALIAGAVALAAPRAMAQAAESSKADQYTTVTFQTYAERTVPRDRLYAQLRAEVTDTDAGRVQAEINRRMAKAIEAAKRSPQVKVQTGSYNIHNWMDPQKQMQWRGQQFISVHAAEFDAVLGIVREMQAAGLLMSGMYFDLLPETRAKLEAEVEAEAMARAVERARALAKAGGTTVAQIRAVRVGSGGIPHPRMMMAAPMAMAKSAEAMPAPQSEAGDQTLRVSVDVEVWLAPIK